MEVTALAAGDSASFLIGTRDRGILFIHAGMVEHADAKSGLPDDEVESTAMSPASAPGRAFVGTPVGTAEFDLTGGSFHPARILAEGLFSHAVALDGDQLDVGTLDQGIQQVPLSDGGSLHRTAISAASESTSVQRVGAFLPAHDGLYALADGALLQRVGTSWHPAFAAGPRCRPSPLR